MSDQPNGVKMTQRSEYVPPRTLEDAKIDYDVQTLRDAERFIQEHHGGDLESASNLWARIKELADRTEATRV